MIKSKILLAAEGVIMDRETQLCSIYNIIEGINVPKFPAIANKICMFCLLQKSDDIPSNVNLTCKLSFNDSIVAETRQDLDFLASNEHKRISTFVGVPFHSEGTVKLSIHYKDKLVGDISFKVNGDESNPNSQNNQ